MPVHFYMDAHVKAAITKGLRLRGVEVMTAQEDSNDQLEDDLLLARATQLGRVLVTYDEGFRVMAEGWQREGRLFVGLVFAEQDARIGWMIEDLHLIASVTSPDEWKNFIQRLPWPRTT